MANINERPDASFGKPFFFAIDPPRPAQSQIVEKLFKGTKTKANPPTPSSTLAQGPHTTLLEQLTKATWEPLQTRIMVAEELTSSKFHHWVNTVKFLDPAGKVIKLASKSTMKGNGFEDGLLQMMQYYNLQSKVEINYTYRLQNYFHLRIFQPNGLGEINYKEFPQVDHEVKKNHKKLWSLTTMMTTMSYPHMVIPVSIVTSEVQENQKAYSVKLPGGEIQSWKLLWNTRIDNYCRLGQGILPVTSRHATLQQEMSSPSGKLLGKHTMVFNSNVKGPDFYHLMCSAVVTVC
ncbi:B3 domain-containing protein [Sesbania bispinosa]|nr:B3 domain-containing protein [Sesbania bispinosa]